MLLAGEHVCVRRPPVLHPLVERVFDARGRVGKVVPLAGALLAQERGAGDHSELVDLDRAAVPVHVSHEDRRQRAVVVHDADLRPRGPDGDGPDRQQVIGIEGRARL